MNNPGKFTTFALLCNQHLGQIQNAFITWEENPRSIKRCSASPPPASPVSRQSLWIYLFWIFHVRESCNVAFCIWLLSLAIMLWGFLRVVACIGTPSLSHGWLILRRVHSPRFFVRWLFSEHPSYSPPLSAVLQGTCIEYLFSILVSVAPRDRMAGSLSNCV